MTDKIARTKITSQDCVLPQMTGKYDLVFYASQRARAIISGSPILVENFEKPQNHSIIVALEEIRQGKLKFEDLIESLSSPFVESASDTFFESRSFDDNEDFEDDGEDEEAFSIDYKSEEEYED